MWMYFLSCFSWTGSRLSAEPCGAFEPFFEADLCDLTLTHDRPRQHLTSMKATK